MPPPLPPLPLTPPSWPPSHLHHHPHLWYIRGQRPGSSPGRWHSQPPPPPSPDYFAFGAWWDIPSQMRGSLVGPNAIKAPSTRLDISYLLGLEPGRWPCLYPGAVVLSGVMEVRWLTEVVCYLGRGCTTDATGFPVSNPRLPTPPPTSTAPAPPLSWLAPVGRWVRCECQMSGGDAYRGGAPC